jgi:hypothetical protein
MAAAKSINLYKTKLATRLMPDGKARHHLDEAVVITHPWRTKAFSLTGDPGWRDGARPSEGGELDGGGT